MFICMYAAVPSRVLEWPKSQQNRAQKLALEPSDPLQQLACMQESVVVPLGYC